MADDVIRLVQLTDFHLTADGPADEWPVDTEATLAAVVERARAEAADAVLATGDLSQDGSVASYRRARALLGRLDVPVHCLPGNHDDPAALAETLAGEGVHVERHLRHGDWQIVFLDSTVPGENDGHLATGELAALDAALSGHPDRHALVCLHHNPVVVGGAWRDVVTLGNPEDLFAALDRHASVRGVLWGHIHQAFDGARGGVKLMGTPSTCFQFVAGEDGGLAIGADPPGYRCIELHADGAITSELRWLDGAGPAGS